MADSNRQLQNVWMFSGQTIFFCYFDALHVVSVISHQLTLSWLAEPMLALREDCAVLVWAASLLMW